MSDTLRDNGYAGVRTSMGGIQSRQGMGLTIWSTLAAPTTTATPISAGNPLRLYTLITNNGTVAVDIAYDATFLNGYHRLQPGGSMLINEDMPWTGEIYAKAVSGTGSLGIFLATIQA